MGIAGGQTADESPAEEMTGQPAGAPARAPRLLEQHLLGVARMAVIGLTGHGRVSHWSTTATELFGIGRDQALGRSLSLLLRLPQEHRGAFEPGTFARAWLGACFVARVDNGELAEVAWWVYPVGPADPAANGAGGGLAVLAIAVDLRRLRDEGPGLGLGDALLVSPAAGPLPATTGLRLLRVEPALVPVGERDIARLSRRLAEVLPLMGPRATESIIGRVLALGYPAVNLSVTVRLPLVPYWGNMPRALRIRPREVSLPGSGTGEGWENMAVRERLRFLSEAGEHIGSSLDHIHAARMLADTLVPEFADFAGVALLEQFAGDLEMPSARVDETAALRRVAVAHVDEPGRWDDTLPLGETMPLPPASPWLVAMTTGARVHYPQVSAEDAERIAALFTDRDLRPLITGRAMLVVPLMARGLVLGTIMLLRKPDRSPFDEMELATAEELGRQAALSIDNGRLYRREVRAAQELQRSMLPADPPQVAGARVCFRYQPAGQAAQVGGDWFDAIPLPGGRLGIVVGDVMGHGLTSAAIMGQLRTVVRTLAVQDLRPDQLLRQLDDLAQLLGEGYLATCLYAVYDPVQRRCQIANAGHVPPVLVSPFGESTVLDLPAGVPIGVGEEAFETVDVAVEDDSQLVLCTDGLLERRRGRDIFEGLEQLRLELAGATRSLDTTCDAVLEALSPGVPSDDDVALVAVGFDGIPKENVAEWNLAAEPSMVPLARSQATGKLAEWGLTELTDTLELLVSELVTNALVHGAGSIGLRLIKATMLMCEVSDDGHELPYLCHAGANDESGRGLQLVTYLAERWGTHRNDTGKVVWCELALPEGS